MRASLACSASLCAVLAQAHPSPAASGTSAAFDPRFTNYVAPGPGDVRSPCPGLNTLANHGFIPHNGKNMTLPVLVAGLSQGMNVGADFTLAIGALGILSSPNPAGGSFDLNDLDEHNFPIEHDASLSRQDYYFSQNDYSFYAPNFDTVISHYTGQSVTTFPVAAAAKYARVENSNQTNPSFTYGFQQFILSYGETALYMQTMGNPVTGAAPIDYVRSLFEKEQLPWDLGWRPATLPITLLSLGAAVLELNAASPDPFAEDQYVTASSYKDVIDDAIGLGAALKNVLDPRKTL